ncbi:MAG: hypothetical protein ABSC77_01600 [Terracidiphilus sp.]|jgi:hypothetical protein
MNSALELIQVVESAGGRFMVDDGRLGIIPATAAKPVMEELRQHKMELLAELARRPAMPAGVQLISWTPKAAPVKLSPCSTATNVDLFVRSTLRQLEARLSGKSCLDGGWGLSGLLDRLAAVGCHVALVDPSRMLQ